MTFRIIPSTRSWEIPGHKGSCLSEYVADHAEIIRQIYYRKSHEKVSLEPIHATFAPHSFES